MNTKKINVTSTKIKEWSHIPYEQKDLPEIGLFFKELYPGPLENCYPRVQHATIKWMYYDI